MTKILVHFQQESSSPRQDAGEGGATNQTQNLLSKQHDDVDEPTAAEKVMQRILPRIQIKMEEMEDPGREKKGKDRRYKMKRGDIFSEKASDVT